jgi:hypothetical protein
MEAGTLIRASQYWRSDRNGQQLSGGVTQYFFSRDRDAISARRGGGGLSINNLAKVHLHPEVFEEFQKKLSFALVKLTLHSHIYGY